MPKSLSEITNAWGKWKASKFGTSLKWTESTRYSNRSDLGAYHQHETKVTTLDTVFYENQGQVVDAAGMGLWYDNNTSTEQTNTFEYEETKAQSFTWSLTESLKIGYTVKVSIGVPDVCAAEATATAEVELSSTQSWTKDNSTTWRDTTPVTIPAKKSVQCQTVLKIQNYKVPFEGRVRLSGCVAVWFIDKVDYNGKNDYHWLWFIPIGEVLSDVEAYNLINSDGYETSYDDVIASANGVLTGKLGISISVNTDEYWLRGWNPSQEEVQQDLMAKLTESVKQALNDNYPSLVGDSTSLTANMRTLADGRFNQDFGHSCNANYYPSDCLGLPHLVDQPTILYKEADLDQQISNFVKSNLLNAADLPAWMQADCTANVTKFVQDLLHEQKDNQCNTTQFIRSYTATRNDQTSMRCVSILVYANGTLTEAGVTSNIHALYFLGVFYPTSSPADTAAGELQDKAYATAAALTSVTSIDDDATLEAALNTYGAAKFQTKYGYAYTGTPVDFPTGESQALLTRNGHLGLFQGRDTSHLDVYVKTEIFGGLNIPIQEARGLSGFASLRLVAANKIDVHFSDAALADVQEVFKAIFEDSQRGAWGVLYIDKMYLLDNVNNVNPVAMNAVVAHWTQDTITEVLVAGIPTQVTVSLTYIHFIGLVHECKPDSLLEDLFDKLCHTIPGKTTATAQDSTLDMELNSYTRKGFQDGFDFDFDDENGPPRKISGFKRAEILFEWPHVPSEEDIKNSIDNLWYERGSTTFVTHCGEEIYDDLVKKIAYRAGEDTVKLDFQWQQNHLTKQYTFPGSDGIRTMEEYNLYSYAYGKITEDGHGGGSKEVFVLSFLVIICQVKTQEPDDDDI